MSVSSSNISAADIFTVENSPHKIIDQLEKKKENENENENKKENENENENNNKGDSKIQPITTIISVESQDQDLDHDSQPNILEFHENDFQKEFENFSNRTDTKNNLRLNHFSNNSILTLNPLKKKGSIYNSEGPENDNPNDTNLDINDINTIKENNIQNNKKPEFLDPENRKLLKEKLELAKEKILNQQEKYLINIRKAISENDIDTIRKLMLDKEKQSFYKRQLESSNFLETMLTENRMEMLTEVLKDNFYHFDEIFVFDYFIKMLKQRGKTLNEIQSLSQFITQFIKNGSMYNSKELLKFIWETKNKAKKDSENKKKNEISIHSTFLTELLPYEDLGIKSHLESFFSSSLKNTIFKDIKIDFSISDILEKLFQANSLEIIQEIISSWKYLDHDTTLLQTLFRNKAYDEISILLYRYPNHPHWRITPNNFKEVILNEGLELIILCLNEKGCKMVLDDLSIQKRIVNNYLLAGEKMYYGAEMLSNIKKTSLDLSLAFNLLSNINSSIKNKNIVNCHSPVLTCLLLCEILHNISEISVHFKIKCEKTRNELMELCRNIHEANPSEKYIEFLLGQKDSRGRTAYLIAAETEAFTVLESPEVGTIVNKMWVGRLRHDGIFAFSSLKKFLESPTTKGGNAFLAFDKIDYNKTYFHQLSLWEESCSLRYYPESISNILLIVLYNLFIFFLVTDDDVMTDFKDLSPLKKKMLICYIIWVWCIVLKIPLQILFSSLSKKRKYKIDFWGYIEICLLLSAFLILVDTEKLFPKYDEIGNKIHSDGKSDMAFIIRASILSVNDIFVWLRITGILLTYKELGPLIRIIYLLSIVAAKYLLIYLIIMICCATIYTTIFYKASKQYKLYSVTFTTLFQGYLNNSKVFDFDYYKFFGAILCITFVTCGGLILVNMLIALLSNEYTQLSKVVDAAHRSVLITYFKRYKWDKNYGYLILLTTPLNILNFFVIPINILFREKKKNLIQNNENEDFDSNEQLEHRDIIKIENSRQQQFNTIISRIYYSIFYFPFIFLIEAIPSFFFIPICYFVGIFTIITEYTSQIDNANLKGHLITTLSWIFGGIPYLLYIYFRDLYELFKTMFLTIDINNYSNEKNRIKDFINKNDIRNFLQFIHKREKTEQNDLHTLFMDFLEFEKEKKAETDKEFKNQVIYYHKLRTAGKTTLKREIISLGSLYHSNKDNINKENELEGRFIKRNLIIIEILENFLIDDGSDNFIVDIDKMKILLPKTMNINNAYIKRLVHTDIASLNKAVNRRKNKGNAFLQHKLLNKIVGSVIRLDKVIDAEGNNDPLQTEEAKKLNKFEIEDNEDDFYTTLEDLLRNISNDVADNIHETELKIYEEENKNKLKNRKIRQSAVRRKVSNLEGKKVFE